MTRSGKPLNAIAAARALEQPWTPVVAGRANGQELRLAWLAGEFDRHRHPDSEEVFYVLEGELELVLDDSTVHLAAGDLYVVPRGTYHRPVAPGAGARVLLVNTAGTRNTGEERTERTLDELEEL